MKTFFSTSRDVSALSHMAELKTLVFLPDENSRRIYRIIGMGWALSNVLAAANPQSKVLSQKSKSLCFCFRSLDYCFENEILDCIGTGCQSWAILLPISFGSCTCGGETCRPGYCSLLKGAMAKGQCTLKRCTLKKNSFFLECILSKELSKNLIGWILRTKWRMYEYTRRSKPLVDGWDYILAGSKDSRGRSWDERTLLGKQPLRPQTISLQIATISISPVRPCLISDILGLEYWEDTLIFA